MLRSLSLHLGPSEHTNLKRKRRKTLRATLSFACASGFYHFPEDLTAAIRCNPDDAATYHNRGCVLHAQGKLEEAISDYSRFLDEHPAFPDGLNDRGLAWHELEQFEQALKDYDRAIEIEPEFSITFYNRGNTWMSLAEFERARSDFNEAIRFDPRDVSSYNNRAGGLQSGGRNQSAGCEHLLQPRDRLDRKTRL